MRLILLLALTVAACAPRPAPPPPGAATTLITNLMKNNPYIVRGPCRAGFTGGWIDGRCNS